MGQGKQNIFVKINISDLFGSSTRSAKSFIKKKRPSRQVSFLLCEDFRNATETFRLTLLSYTVSITAKYYISAKIKGQIIYKEKKRKNINIFFRDLHKVRIRGIDFTPNIY